MSLLYTIAMPRPCGRPTVADQPDHRDRRARARGMREAGLTLKAIAARLGVNERTLRRWARMDALSGPMAG